MSAGQTLPSLRAGLKEKGSDRVNHGGDRGHSCGDTNNDIPVHKTSWEVSLPWETGRRQPKFLILFFAPKSLTFEA
jgi:hypothetical protein